MEVRDCDEGKMLIKKRWCNTKVLLVLDDVSLISQLENLAGKKEWFGQGSRIIITTRDQRLLVEHGVPQYKMNFLSQVDSHQLFLEKAFKEDQPNEHYLELSKTVIKAAKGFPLALKVFGSFLCGRSESEWEDALRKVPPNGILEILKVSFDGLEYNEKNIFLDIACFFNGMAKDDVIQILESCGLCAKIGIGILIEKSMVTESDGCLRVHDASRNG
ncbi:TMV resistance protein N-like [Neltuma alba]|uniref:TMV resistance protein N-like n=1 Tax=Neltuma alba TaxID=207710 RepID=UPI0010A4E532|nr:TMV resistance protein N-like [Prosopis alba]